MNDTPPTVSEDALNLFAYTVGQTIQNFGTIEYLINETIEQLVKDRLQCSQVIKLPLVKRMHRLKILAAKDSASLLANEIDLAKLIESAKACFKNRNKVAHNPVVIKKTVSNEVTSISIRIHVCRYAEARKTEEWLDIPELEAFKIQSRDLLQPFNKLLAFYSK